ncbi:MAG: phage terminase large subunit family protein [Cetobacterium sp.]|uniref:phage terminase large subunit family protein n=1 Tax=Cetobacterium sp. TaxID=2071632 RepID=UPI003F2F46C7
MMFQNEEVKKLFKRLYKNFEPPQNLSIAEWADKYRVVSKESAAESGNWDTGKTPYMYGIYESICHPQTEEVTIMSSAQVGKSEMVMNIFGRYAHLDPCPMMIVQPTVDEAKFFSKMRIAPMIRDTKVLRELISQKENVGGDSVQLKSFPGGTLMFVGANSPSGLASKPIKITLLDEVDRFPESAGQEGDPVQLAEKRTTTFYDRKKIRVSTPTIEGVSKIKQLFLNSSQEEWCLPCPDCGEYQTIDWSRTEWETKESPVLLQCEHCGCLNDEKTWKKLGQKNGKWVASNPDNLKHRGFHMNALASPWVSWEEIRDEFLKSKDSPEKLKVFVNTVLGETWVIDLDEILDYEAIFDSREDYAAELHEDILLLTAGVDVQDNRIEIEVVGWSKGYESYGVLYKQIPGNPAELTVWQELDEFLKREFKFKDGSSLGIACTCIDTGGHHTAMAYKYISPIQNSRRIYGIKGQGGDGVAILNGFRKTKDKTKIDLLSIGVNTLKDLLYGRLKIIEGEGKCHFPASLEAGYGINYFKSLTAETKRLKKNKIEWVKIYERNEALDLRNYATAAVEILKPNFDALMKMSRENLSKLAAGKSAKKKSKAKTGKGVEV